MEVEELVGGEDGVAKRGQGFQPRRRNVFGSGREQTETLLVKDLFLVGGEIQIKLGRNFHFLTVRLIEDSRSLADCGGRDEQSLDVSVPEVLAVRAPTEELSLLWTGRQGCDFMFHAGLP